MTYPTLTTNPNRIELDEAYMQMAEVWAQRSKANRLQVGALIVRNKRIISDGYNGMPSGASDDVCESIRWLSNDLVGKVPDEDFPYSHEGHQYRLDTKPDVLHAESNALLKITEDGGSGAQGGTLYVTHSPCPECAKLIVQSKLARVVYRHQYRLSAGIDILRRYGVQVDHLPEKK